jgi:hypothetical protein
MTIDLAEIAAPGHTAIVTQECQGAVVARDAGVRIGVDITLSLLATITNTDDLIEAWK